MNKRLNQLYNLIPKDGIGLIDVGTDHGLIPIRLAQSHYPGNIIASDIVEGPLLTAQENAVSCGFSDNIRFLLCDGLDLCPPNEIDTILIAGMGGDTICGILDRADWIFSGQYNLILQPMTRSEVVRYWLVHNGFRIVQEAIVEEEQHIYQIILSKLGEGALMTDAEYLVGSCDVPRTGDILPLLRQQLKNVRKKLNGLEKASISGLPTQAFYQAIEDELVNWQNGMTRN